MMLASPRMFPSEMMSLREFLWQISHHCDLWEQHHYAQHNIISPQAIHHNIPVMDMKEAIG
jgi:hypothetical protein